ncbi:RISC-loading complex subunit tarbp2 isoform X2 [Anopheles funestus]|uniref:RISC-loading complex subunit tarbp2 isoform X2 n=1 Tax=Anopheles funestus TaxID=62324 RepID=UPI0020C5DE7C|nr:RISC-loading complex subunit tarbp2 isoform X2 [Anopheles funestus]
MEQQCLDMSQPMLTIPNDPPVGVPNPHQGGSKKGGRNKKSAKNAECSVPIEEALKTELTTNNMKTPISVLQELLSRRGITPQYDLIQVEGAVHEPTFRYRVSYKDKDAMGTGKSKKEAKHAAAKALIEKLTGSTFNDYPGATNNMKTPISVLQELLSRRGITPQYDLIQVEGTVHEPAFRYRVSYQDKDAMGTGKSKKEAKQAAARALIEKLMGSVYYDQHDRTILNGLKPDATSVQTITNSATINEEEPTGNPIGWLQEMCMARRWPPPTYETETEKGLPHERQFTIACVVLKFREVGEGKSKKVAKRQAAQKMWQRLQDQPMEPNQLLDEDGNEEVNLHRYAGLKDVCTPTLTTNQSQKVSQYHKMLKSRTGENLQELQYLNIYDPDQDCIDILAIIAKEQRFEVTYVNIDEKSLSDEFQCLVQLSTMPVAVCYGSGLTIQEANMRAAQNSLEYLKILTKC